MHAQYRQYLSAMTNSTDCHLPAQHIMSNLGIILVKLIECAHFEEQHDISVLLLYLPVLFLRICVEL